MASAPMANAPTARAPSASAPMAADGELTGAVGNLRIRLFIAMSPDQIRPGGEPPRRLDRRS